MNFWFRLSFRTRLGIIGSVFLAFALVRIFLWYLDPVRFTPHQFAWLLYLGPLLFLLWLAWGDIEKIPWWNWLIIAGVLLVCALKPGAWFVGIPIIAYIIFAARKR